MARPPSLRVGLVNPCDACGVATPTARAAKARDQDRWACLPSLPTSGPIDGFRLPTRRSGLAGASDSRGDRVIVRVPLGKRSATLRVHPDGTCLELHHLHSAYSTVFARG